MTTIEELKVDTVRNERGKLIAQGLRRTNKFDKTLNNQYYY